MNEKKYYIPDIESGHSYEVSKETYENYIKMWECARATIKDKKIGIPIIFGTGGEFTDNKYLEKIFKQEPNE